MSAWKLKLLTMIQRSVVVTQSGGCPFYNTPGIIVTPRHFYCIRGGTSIYFVSPWIKRGGASVLFTVYFTYYSSD
jgi:hypothetical protein